MEARVAVFSFLLKFSDEIAYITELSSSNTERCKTLDTSLLVRFLIIGSALVVGVYHQDLLF